jgi:hypothetical protein
LLSFTNGKASLYIYDVLNEFVQILASITLHMTTIFITNDVRVFDFSNNCWFYILKYCKIKELIVLVFWGKNQSKKFVGLGYFKNNE